MRNFHHLSYHLRSIDEVLNKTEQTFRDPNLLIDSIRELNLKQIETIKTIQSKLVEMVQVKEDLKASNEFKPYLSFSKDLFG